MELHFETCAELAWPDEAERQAMNELPAKREVHAELVDVLGGCEVVGGLGHAVYVDGTWQVFLVYRPVAEGLLHSVHRN